METARSFRELDAWLTRSNWFILLRTERDDGSWDIEAISPSGRIVGFSGEKDVLAHWNPMPQNVEVINDEDVPVITKERRS